MTCVICRRGEARRGKATVTPERGEEPSSSELRTPPDGLGEPSVTFSLNA
jgi:hypothetical protein